MSNAVANVAPQSSEVAFSDMQRMAASVAKSGLFGVENADQALTLLLIAQSEGRHPMLAIRDYHLIKGKPALKADTLLARFQAAGGSVDWKEYTDTKCVGVFSHPQGGSVTVDWTMERAKNAGLAGKDVWKSYPRAMLRARCISEGVRTCFPGIAVGIYTPEEIESGTPEMLDVTPPKTEAELERVTAQVVKDLATAMTSDEVDEYINAMDNATTTAELQAAYMGGYTHASRAKDNAAKKRLDAAYAVCKGAVS